MKAIYASCKFERMPKYLLGLVEEKYWFGGKVISILKDIKMHDFR